MKAEKSYLEEVGQLLQDIHQMGFKPILVGGMALVTMGSRRVTRDFDFVISKSDELLEDLVRIFYRRGLELASKVNDEGDITATIDNPKIATLRIKMDKPDSIYFLNPKTGLKVDLLFDYPIGAEELEKTAKRIKIGSYVFLIASEKDLIRMKEIAKDKRSNPGDLQDLAFLRKRRR